MTAQVPKSTRSLVTVLGLAGLSPFLLGAAWAILQPINYMPMLIFCYYSACILSFLAGSLWRHQGQSISLLIQSNAITLLAVFALVIFHLEPNYSIFLLMCGFVWMLNIDLFRSDYALWYKQLRSLLSIIVVALHGVLLTFL